MKIHRFYIKDTGFTDRLLLTKKEYPGVHNQMVNVLKLQKEEQVTLFNDFTFTSINDTGKEADVVPVSEINQTGQEYTYIIKGIGNKEVLLILKDRKENVIDLALKNKESSINLYIANIKKDKLEWCLEKAVELGVSNIYPLDSERSQKLNTKINSTESTLIRFEKIITEATEQCGRGELAKMHITQKLEDILFALKPRTDINKENNYACIINKEDRIKKDGVEQIEENKQENKIVNIFIGPEGGWTDKEEALFLGSGFKTLNLGPTILRAETAAICAMSKFV